MLLALFLVILQIDGGSGWLTDRPAKLREHGLHINKDKIGTLIVQLSLDQHATQNRLVCCVFLRESFPGSLHEVKLTTQPRLPILRLYVTILDTSMKWAYHHDFCKFANAATVRDCSRHIHEDDLTI